MLWKYTLQYYKNSHLDEVEIHSRIEGELRSDFVGISVCCSHTDVYTLALTVSSTGGKSYRMCYKDKCGDIRGMGSNNPLEQDMLTSLVRKQGRS